MNPAVIAKIRRVIEMCGEKGIETGICGDGPSSNPEMARILVEEGIGSIGVTPDRYLPTHRLVRAEEEERRLKEKGIRKTVLYQAPLKPGGNGDGKFA